MNILRVRQAAAREDRIAFKLSGRLATSAPAPTLRAHACALTRERASEPGPGVHAQHPMPREKESNPRCTEKEQNTATFHYFRLSATKLQPSARDTSLSLSRFVIFLFSLSRPFSSRFHPAVCLANERHRNFLPRLPVSVSCSPIRDTISLQRESKLAGVRRSLIRRIGVTRMIHVPYLSKAFQRSRNEPSKVQ